MQLPTSTPDDSRSALNAKPLSTDLVALARERLRSAILTGQFEAGVVMSQPQLSDALDVGRTPLREAIRLLQEEGLLISDPHRRVRIAGFSIEDLEDLYTLRLATEASAIRMSVPGLTAEDHGELEGLLAKMEHFGQRHQFELFEAPNREFHALLVSGAGGRSRRLAETLSEHAERYRRVYLSQPDAYEISRGDHLKIATAAIAQDTEGCVRAVVSHYVHTAEAVAAKLDPTPNMRRLAIASAAATGQQL
jgi:DNA-binding GntR family transcriptional regulator